MTVVLLSKYLGVILSVMGLGYLLNSKHIPQMFDELKSNVTLLMLTGIIGIVIGLTIVLNVSLPATGVTLLLVILGYLILIEGVLTIIFPNFYLGVLKFIVEKITVRIFSILLFLMGLILMYDSFLK